MNSHTILDFLNVDEHAQSTWGSSYAAPAVKLEPPTDGGDSWSRLLTMAVDDDDENAACIPGGLSQISLSSSSASSGSRSPTPDLQMPGVYTAARSASNNGAAPPSATVPVSTLSPPTILPTFTSASVQRKPSTVSSSTPSSSSPNQKAPHPYAISPSYTAQFFSRASSVSSQPAASTPSGGPAKKIRAPPSGPISTKDFIPPDVSGLNKREARLVKNRAAAFLSRQRKREEFELLEARVEVLESDNARLYRDLEAYKTGGAPAPTSLSAGDPLAHPTVQSEMAALKRQIAELTEKAQQVDELYLQLQAKEREEQVQKPSSSSNVKQEEFDDDESDSDSISTVNNSSGKKDGRSAGSVALMVLLFSLSTLLTNAKQSSANPPKPQASARVPRRPMHAHHRSSSSSLLSFSDPFRALSGSAAYEPPLSSSLFAPDDGMLWSTGDAFGLDEDFVFGSPAPTTVAAPASVPVPAGTGFDTELDLQNAISSVKATGPNAFEFDFTLPSSPSSSVDYAFASTSSWGAKKSRGKKTIKVCVKSAVPLDLKLDGVVGKAVGETLESPVKFQPDDDLDFYDAASSLPSGSTSPSSDGLGKRKRVVVEINPHQRRRISEDGERWDVNVSQQDYDDDDTMMA